MHNPLPVPVRFDSVRAVMKGGVCTCSVFAEAVVLPPHCERVDVMLHVKPLRRGYARLTALQLAMGNAVADVLLDESGQPTNVCR